MHFLRVKPAPGRSPRHETPPHAPIAGDGEHVPATPYYLRQRDLHGDTVDAPDPTPPELELEAGAEVDPAVEISAPTAKPAARSKSKPSPNQKKEA